MVLQTPQHFLNARPTAEISPSLPLVSIAVVNWNYGRFLRQCIESISAQDYPHIEVAILDNGSSDDSRAVIGEGIAGDRRFQTIFLDSNVGQMNGGLYCLERLSGEFICFIDADDYLFPDFVSTHVQVHLALPLGVGLTSSNPVEISAKNRILTGARKEFARTQPVQRNVLRSLECNPPRVPTISDDAYRQLSNQVDAAPPTYGGPGRWAPGTANCYRRSVIDLVKPRADEILSRVTIDAHFSRLVHWVAGAAMIDRALSVYRIDGDNHFTSVASISGIGATQGGIGATATLRKFRRGLRVRTLLEQHRPLAAATGRKRFLEILSSALKNAGSQIGDVELRKAVSQRLPELIESHGQKETLNSLRAAISHRALMDIIKRSDPAALPKSIVLRAHVIALHRAVRQALEALRAPFRGYGPAR